MPRNTWIDKTSATTFRLVHRAQDDPRIHDEEASSMVLAEISGPKQKRFKTRWDIEDELGLDPSSIRDNEGEAALYGVYYDDTDYDYMQHMRDLGTSSDGRFIEGGYTQISSSRKGKAKQTLEDALKDACLDDVRSADHGNEDSMGSKALIELDILPPMSLKQTTYEHQQDVPDALAGFQPDMDPRLREVLEALEDEAYVDEEDETFAELARGREEISQGDFEWSARTYDDGSGASLDDGWETDDTTKPLKEHKSRSEETGDGDVVMADSPAEEGKGWEAEYGKFKTDKQKVKAKPVRPTHSSLSSSVVTGSSITDGRRKKRKGALTSSTSYSMTSSSLARTEGLTLLDDRFDQIEKMYADDELDEDARPADGAASIAAASSVACTPSGPVRSDLDSMMDEFLGSYSMTTGKNKKRLRRVGNQTGLEQLDEIKA